MSSGGRIGVLVVDASDVFLASALHWIDSRADLRFAGVARNQAEALEALDRLCPDLVIIECVMNGADGFQLSREIKARNEPPLVLLVTFYANEVTRNEALAAGADGFLAKYDLFDGFDALLAEWQRDEAAGRAPLTPRATPDRRGSRTVPDP